MTRSPDLERAAVAAPCRPLPALALLCALLATGLLAWGCNAGGKGGKGRGGKNEAAAAEAGDEAVPAEVVTVRTGPVTDTVLATATLTSRREVTLLAGAMGELVALEVDEGDVVDSGQLLGRVHNGELSLAVERARSQIRRAQAEVDRLEPLNEKGYIPRAEYDRAVTELEIAREEAKRARIGASDARIEAPFDGVVALRHIEPGSQVTAAQPVLTILDPAQLQAVVQVPERVLGVLRPGQKARVVSEALGDAQPFDATIAAIAPTVDPTSGTVKLDVVLDSIETPDGRRLRPGMFVEVRIVTETREDVPLVPKRALLFEETRPYVFVARHDQARLSWLETGTAADDLVEVRSGLEAGDQVVVLGQAGLKDGTALRVIRRDGAAVDEPGAPQPSAGEDSDEVQ